MNFTINREERYVMIAKPDAQNKALSFGARGVWAYILSLPDDAPLTSSDLARRSPNTPHEIEVYLIELEAARLIIAEGTS